MTDELNNEQGSYSDEYMYPAKPNLPEEGPQPILRTILSLGLYFLFFYFLFERNIKYIAALTLVILIHELGHILAMKFFNYNGSKLLILPFLGKFVSDKNLSISQWQLSYIILAGPLPGLIIAFILYWMNNQENNQTIKMLAHSFLFINLFNLLPLFPLDGGRLLETLFSKQNHVIRMLFSVLSIIILTVLFFYSSPILLIVPLMMVIDVLQEYKNMKIRKYLDSENINYSLHFKELSNKDYWLIRDCILFSFSSRYKGVEPGYYQYHFAEPIIAQHVSLILQPTFKKKMETVTIYLILLLYLSSFLLPVIIYRLFF